MIQRLEGWSHRICELQILAAETLFQAEVVGGHESFTLSLKHARLDRLPEVVLFDDHVFICLEVSPLVHLLLSCHGLLGLSGEALVDDLEHVLLLDNTAGELVALLLDNAHDLVPVGQFLGFAEEIFLLELVDFATFAHALARSHVSMVINLDERIFVAEDALGRDNDQVEHLDLTLDDLLAILSVLLDQVVASTWPLLAPLREELLQLRTILPIIVLIDDYDLLGDLELAVDDKVNTIGSIALLVEHLVPLKSSLLEALPKVLLRVPGEQGEKTD